MACCHGDVEVGHLERRSGQKAAECSQRRPHGSSRPARRGELQKTWLYVTPFATRADLADTESLCFLQRSTKRLLSYRVREGGVR